MKRFGIPILLSLVYVCLMIFVFSSDFGQKNSFLFENNKVVESDKVEENTKQKTASNLMIEADKEDVISQGEAADPAPL
ncbi:MAG TPA: hypothetical protein ENJ82_09580 [Bacteroidetes bacterium]|nr:hypothetical protein [Bacteroidota bacterium]